MIEYKDFEQVDLRVGTIIKVEEFLKAKKAAYKIWVDFGAEIGIKQTSAQITENYNKEELVGRQIIGCINLTPKNIAGFMSEFLLTGFNDDKDFVVIATVSTRIANGQKLF